MQRASFSIDSLISGNSASPGYRNPVAAFQLPFFYNGYVFLPRSGLYPAGALGFPGQGPLCLPDHFAGAPRPPFPDAPLDCRNNTGGYNTAASPSSTTSNRSSVFDLQHSK
ncbi:homeobox protein GBX-2 [Trichonephila inaurata madagascariensis]|uniref:Homeobox protein GBX-2 n=1 Tax=Trichonephila inaurata madagascariensis TaxID=2747483 RepID=A0A8X7BVT8_9ARAC|nr:homeobox protein GBX-2 [Trichonephila inaurata madagascariensis]